MSTRPPLPLTRAQRFGVLTTGGRAAAASPPSPATPLPRSDPQSRAPEMSGSGQEVVIGLLERLTQVNADWSVGSIYSDERKTVSVVGAGLRDLAEGNEYTFTGRFKTHPKYGLQLDVFSAMPYVRPDRASIVKYIAKNFKGVGHITAEKFIDRRLGSAADKDQELENLRQQLINAPWTIDFAGVTKKASFKPDEDSSPILAYVHRDLATRLGGMPGVKDSVLKSLAQYLLGLNSGSDAKKVELDPKIVQKCWASLCQDPYEPTKHVPGFAFTTADVIGANVNIPRDAPVRLKALVAHALDLGCQRAGHTYLSRSDLTQALQRIDPRAPAQEAIEHGLKHEMIILDDEFGEQRYYTPRIYEAEVELAQGLVDLCRESRPLSSQPVEQLEKKVQEIARSISPAMKKDGLDKSQLDAIIGIMTSKTRLHTLTAGPGCGKTQIMEVLSKALEHKDFVFCGPTGKSAKVLSSRLESQGREASTIHSTLMGSGRGSFRYNKGNTLDGDVLVCDETSMNDVELAEALVAAANSKMHVIFLGDPDQLPSIGPGSVLKDLLQIKAGDHHRLSKTHRNSGGILDVLEQIRHGQIDCVDRPGVKFSHKLGSAEEDFPNIARKYVEAVSKHGFDGVSLVMSLRAGEPDVAGWNITYANRVLRDLCNPHADKIPGTKLFVGDRIIVRDNMTIPLAGTARDKPAQKKGDEEPAGLNETRVVNGDTGTILSYERDPQNPRSLMARSICLKLDDGRMVDLPGQESGALQHSYAITVHSAQGSEYKKVIAVITPGHSSFINRAMAFTGLSRAREGLDINAEDAVLRKVAATPLPERNSALVERVSVILKEQSVETEEEPPQRPVPQQPIGATPRSARFAPPAQSVKPVSEMSLSARYAMRQRS